MSTPGDGLDAPNDLFNQSPLLISEEQVQRLVDHIVENAMDQFMERLEKRLDDKIIPILYKHIADDLYKTAGRIIISKILWLVGICAIGFCVWIVSSGKVKVGVDP